MTDKPTQDQIEALIHDWYWDALSHEFARQLGALLLSFMDYLQTLALSERTIRQHRGNCWLIGYLVCNYSYHDSFSPAIFLGEPSYLYEFKRKVSSSKYAAASYKATWRKLQKYVRQSYTSN